MTTRVASLVLVLVVMAAPASSQSGPSPRTPLAAAAQAPAGSAQPPDAKEPPTPRHTGLRAFGEGLLGDVRHLPSRPNLSLVLLGSAGAALAHPVDDEVNVHLRGPNQAARAAFGPGKYVGNTVVQVGAALSTYAVGRLEREGRVAHLGMDLLRAQMMASGLTTGLKYATHRERPDGSNAHSFPSGHAAITFATATVLERHLGWRMSALGYSLASYVAASRLHDNRHYLSDVVFGAAVGAVAGRTVTQHGRTSWTWVPVGRPGGVGLLVVHGARAPSVQASDGATRLK